MRSAFFTAFFTAVILCTAAVAQGRNDGTLGNRCFDDGSCIVGLACNSSNLCENCGGHGERACAGGYCEEAYRGMIPVMGFCTYPFDDFTQAQNCGSAGFFMCKERNYCWGASVPNPGTNLCVACGLLGQFCCEGQTCREPLNRVSCVSNRCLPVRNPAQPGSGTQGGGTFPQPPSGSLFDPDYLNRPSFDDYMDELERREQQATPPAASDNLPPVLQRYAGQGLHSCACRSSDGRNEMCANNGCSEPPNFSGQCQWTCDDANGKTHVFRGRDGVLLR